ncbi:hypothetical protein [Hansschlegelia plantiphila]|uniref:Uncharacterized protein n=1 Tax=Hansschlegelia plantiphila TaxID=374655 RepID=A0A9W6J1K2_9HYPH|nr:hypothetical protein [Hansschlegelia plantiphila]GLK67688.1 hypothetical protein GCM10008179_13260 [Hansschlegelia plantiphila]
MTKSAAFFVAAAMAVTAACVGVITFYGLDLSIGVSALVAFCALGGMAVTQLAFTRAPAGDPGRLDDLDWVVTDLQSRLETIEARMSTLDAASGERARNATRPVVEELAALGGLVTSIAKEVAAHDVKFAQLAAEKAREAAEAQIAAEGPAPP